MNGLTTESYRQMVRKECPKKNDINSVNQSVETVKKHQTKNENKDDC